MIEKVNVADGPVLVTLSCGLRMVHVRRRGAAVVWAGVAIAAGSRHEQPSEYGLAHFVEHNIFKGTTHRRAGHILNRMERVGGELNAYTTKEETVVYAVAPAAYTERAMEVVADLVTHATFPATEVERERGVVLEEVAGYRDTPAEAIYDDFDDLVFAGTPLGHNVLGTPQSVASLTADHCRGFVERHYRANRMVAFVVGDIDVARAQRIAERVFGDIRPPQTYAIAEAVPDGVDRHSEQTLGLHQVHALMGTLVPGRHHDDCYTLALLSNLLGGPGMNSLLNVELRERRGYVYTVESSLALYADCGLLTIYLGCEPCDLRASLRVVDRVVDRLAGTTMSARRLDEVKRQYCGQLLVASDSTEWIAMDACRQVLRYGEYASPAEVMDHYYAVSAESLRTGAERLAAHRRSSLIFR